MNAQIVVAGAGHNSLITAAYLALAGYSVVVLDARAIPGGGAASEELLGPGYVIDSCSTGHTLIQTNPLLLDDELGLRDRYGLEYLEPDPFAHVAFPDGTHLTAWLDRERTIEEIARFSKADARGLRAAARRVRRGQAHLRRRDVHAGRLRAVAGAAPRRPPDLAAPARDERVGRDPPSLRGRAHPGVPAVAGLPDARAGRLRRLRPARVLARVRPPAALVDDPARRVGRADRRAGALHRRARRRRCCATAASTRLLLSGGRCRGVETEDGERFTASEAVVSTIHVKHLLEMRRRLGRGLPLRRRDVRRRRVGDGDLHGGAGAAGLRGRRLGGLRRAGGVPARRDRVRPRAARRPLRRGSGVAARRDADARRPVARARGSPHREVPVRAVVRVPGAQGGAGRPAARAPATGRDLRLRRAAREGARRTSRPPTST